MGQVQEDNRLPDRGPAVDRRRGGLVGTARRGLIAVTRSRWLAMFAVAFAVSWAFHQVDEIGQHRLEHQQAITQCTIEGVAMEQSMLTEGAHVDVASILQRCEQQLDN